MQHATILHICSFAYTDCENIGAQHAIVPNRAFRADFDIANNGAAGRDKGAAVNFWRLAVDWDDIYAGVGF